MNNLRKNKPIRVASDPPPPSPPSSDGDVGDDGSSDDDSDSDSDSDDDSEDGNNGSDRRRARGSARRLRSRRDRGDNGRSSSVASRRSIISNRPGGNGQRNPDVDVVLDELNSRNNVIDVDDPAMDPSRLDPVSYDDVESELVSRSLANSSKKSDDMVVHVIGNRVFQVAKTPESHPNVVFWDMIKDFPNLSDLIDEFRSKGWDVPRSVDSDSTCTHPNPPAPLAVWPNWTLEFIQMCLIFIDGTPKDSVSKLAAFRQFCKFLKLVFGLLAQFKDPAAVRRILLSTQVRSKSITDWMNRFKEGITRDPPGNRPYDHFREDRISNSFANTYPSVSRKRAEEFEKARKAAKKNNQASAGGRGGSRRNRNRNSGGGYDRGGGNGGYNNNNFGRGGGYNHNNSNSSQNGGNNSNGANRGGSSRKGASPSTHVTPGRGFDNSTAQGTPNAPVLIQFSGGSEFKADSWKSLPKDAVPIGYCRPYQENSCPYFQCRMWHLCALCGRHHPRIKCKYN